MSRLSFQETRQLPFLKKRKEKRKYVARPGIELRTPDLRVRCPTDCATRPGSQVWRPLSYVTAVLCNSVVVLIGGLNYNVCDGLLN